MKFVTVKDLKVETPKVLKLTDQGEDVVVTYRGKPRALIRRLTEDEIEDYVIANSPKIRKLLGEAEQEMREGKLVDFEEFLNARKAKRKI
jgi:antitoxin (DNA-binding transcriptional repressor) of toxin-antitoxin stability system